MRVTASKLELAHACGYPFRPDVRVPYDPAGPAAMTGTAFASLRANAIDGRPIDIPQGADEGRARRMFAAWSDWFAGARGTLQWETEVPFAFDPSTFTARRLPTNGQRDYSAARPGEIVGTADLFAIDGDRVIVRDDKTGRPENVEPVATNAQLRGLAVMATIAHGKTAAHVALDFVSEGGVSPVTHDLEEPDLDAAAADIRTAVARIPGAEPTPGEHCRSCYCPARSICPAFTAAASDVSEASALVQIAKRGGKLTPELAAKAWPQLRLIKAGVEQIEGRIREMVEESGGEIAIGGGKALRLSEQTRENLSASSIRRALGDDATPLLDSLRETGAIEVSTFKTLREVKAAKR